MTESSCLSISQSMAFRVSGRDRVTSTATAEASVPRPSRPRRNSSTSTDGSDEGSFITTFTITPEGREGVSAVRRGDGTHIRSLSRRNKGRPRRRRSPALRRRSARRPGSRRSPIPRPPPRSCSGRGRPDDPRRGQLVLGPPDEHVGPRTSCSRRAAGPASARKRRGSGAHGELVGRPSLDPSTLGSKEGPVRPERSAAFIGPIRVGCRVRRARSRAPESRKNSSNSGARRAAPAKTMMHTLAPVRERARNTARRGRRAGRALP